MDTPNVELFVLAGVGVWIGIGLLISRVGGWAALATLYGHSGEFRGDCLRFQSARMRWGTSYGNCLTVGANRLGLYLSVLFILRIGHPPLFIPWMDISINEQRGRWFNSVVLRFRRAPSIPLQVSQQLGRWLADRAGSSRPRQVETSIRNAKSWYGTPAGALHKVPFFRGLSKATKAAMSPNPHDVFSIPEVPGSSPCDVAPGILSLIRSSFPEERSKV